MSPEPPPVVLCCGSLQVRITEVEPVWRWEILRGEEVIQEGCSISLDAAYRDGQKIARVLDR
jgi:soluble methane monooxygenase-binding protein MmoD